MVVGLFMRAKKLFIFYFYKKNIVFARADEGKTSGSGFI